DSSALQSGLISFAKALICDALWPGLLRFSVFGLAAFALALFAMVLGRGVDLVVLSTPLSYSTIRKPCEGGLMPFV
ncbi:hypothetical protein K6V98_07800, partial [Collinsella sp. AGMB00827]